MTTWPQVLTPLIARQDLTREQAAWAMGEIMRGEAPPSRGGELESRRGVLSAEDGKPSGRTE